MVKGIKEVLGGDKIEFYPDLPRKEKTYFLESNFIINEVKLVDDWDSRFGTSSFYLVKLTSEVDQQGYTTILGGQALVKQLRKLSDKRALPVRARLTLTKFGDGREYYILDEALEVK